MQQIGFLLQNLLSAQHVSCTVVPIIRSSIIIQMSAACGTWVFGLPVVGLVSGLRHSATRKIIELLMIGTMVPETC